MFEVEFNVPVPKIEGVITLTEKEAKEKKMGTCRWIYKGDSINNILELVEKAKLEYKYQNR